MNNYIKELMAYAKQSVEKVFILADRITGLCGEVFENSVGEMQFDPSTLTYILVVGSGEYRISMNLDKMAVEVTGRSVNTGEVVAFCHVGVNGAFKIEYGRGHTSVKTSALKLFDLIEDINISSLQEEFEAMETSQNIEVIADEEDK